MDEYQVDTEYNSGENQGCSSTSSVSKELCSPFTPISPVVSDAYLLSCVPSIDPLITVTKQDAVCQKEYITQNVSTQIERFQSHQITQCGVKTKLKYTQTAMVNFSEKSTQAAPDPVICVDSAVQHECQNADRCVELYQLKDVIQSSPV